jgi:hypothetical protein
VCILLLALIGIEFSFWKCRLSYGGKEREAVSILHMIFLTPLLEVTLRDRIANKEARGLLQTVIYAR